MAEVDRLAEAERGGRLRQLGNWTLGQTLGHLAGWAEYSGIGAPLKVPFFVKWILPPAQAEVPSRADAIRRADSAASPAARWRTSRCPLDDGLARMRRVMARLKAEAPAEPRATFGPLTHDEWIALQLQHAELHLGFLVAE